MKTLYQNKAQKEHRETTLSPQAHRRASKRREDVMKGWMHCGVWKTLAGPRLTDAKVPSHTKADAIKLNGGPSNATH